MQNKKKNHVNRIIIKRKNNITVLGDSINPQETNFPIKPNALNIFPIEDNHEYLVQESLKRDLSQVEKLRFDPINQCNQACIFCPNNLKEKPARINHDSLQLLLLRISKTCNRLTFGCSYEPLMEKNISDYAKIIKSTINDHFENKPKINLVTNGLLLHKRDISSMIELCDWVHISIHSCRKDHFEIIEKRSNFDLLTSNVKNLRKQYNNLRIHIEMVINKINIGDADEYVTWAYNELGVNSINMRLVSLDRYHPKSYLAETIKSNIQLAVTLKEWKQVINNMKKKWQCSITDVTTSLDKRTPVIEFFGQKQ